LKSLNVNELSTIEFDNSQETNQYITKNLDETDLHLATESAQNEFNNQKTNKDIAENLGGMQFFNLNITFQIHNHYHIKK
jgi:hypothetical protein